MYYFQVCWLTDPVITHLRRDLLDIKLKVNSLIESFEDFKHKVLAMNSPINNNIYDLEESLECNNITGKFPLNEDDLNIIENLLEDTKVKNTLVS